ncbi:MAG: TetR/AcrR family transcriptional regulator [Gammaproteobacteria bacterium]
MSIHSSEVVKNVSQRRLTQAERTALSDIRMVETAIDLIVRHGVEGMTLKEVGESAGYSRSLAGYRFGSKEGLMKHVIRSIGDEWLQELKQVTADKVGLDAICAAIDAHYRFCREAPNHVLAFYILWFQSVSPGSLCKDTMMSIHKRRQKDVAEWIKQGMAAGLIDASVEADVIAEQFCSAVVGIVYQWLLNPEAMDEVEKLHRGLKQTMQQLLLTKNERDNQQ